MRQSTKGRNIDFYLTISAKTSPCQGFYFVVINPSFWQKRPVFLTPCVHFVLHMLVFNLPAVIQEESISVFLGRLIWAIDHPNDRQTFKLALVYVQTFHSRRQQTCFLCGSNWIFSLFWFLTKLVTEFSELFANLITSFSFMKVWKAALSLCAWVIASVSHCNVRKLNPSKIIK